MEQIGVKVPLSCRLGHKSPKGCLIFSVFPGAPILFALAPLTFVYIQDIWVPAEQLPLHSEAKSEIGRYI
ncbi:hypothetical protein [Tabrizicola sp. M-4]|uniref:hypothetical protein n=1 Tax=Tabrizicola sp. M-4 TaxID=3055847 RepID=UPI003DA97F06